MGSRGTPLAGSVLAGRYRLSEPLAVAGRHQAWQANDEVADRPVRVEIIAVPAEDEMAEVRHQASAAARLTHPGVARVLDLVEHDERSWLVTEFIAAPTLDEVLARSGPLGERDAARLGVDILDTLMAALAGGVEVRDVRPSTILVTGDGRAVLTGIGVDRSTYGSADPYASPELASGVRAGGLRSDLWSLGATLHAAVHGQPPGPNGSTPRGMLDAVLVGLLATDPGQRPSAEEADQLLRDVAEGVRADEVPVRRFEPPLPVPITVWPEATEAAGPAAAESATAETIEPSDGELAAAFASLDAALSELQVVVDQPSARELADAAVTEAAPEAPEKPEPVEADATAAPEAPTEASTKAEPVTADATAAPEAPPESAESVTAGEPAPPSEASEASERPEPVTTDATTPPEAAFETADATAPAAAPAAPEKAEPATADVTAPGAPSETPEKAEPAPADATAPAATPARPEPATADATTAPEAPEAAEKADPVTASVAATVPEAPEQTAVATGSAPAGTAPAADAAEEPESAVATGSAPAGTAPAADAAEEPESAVATGSAPAGTAPAADAAEEPESAVATGSAPAGTAPAADAAEEPESAVATGSAPAGTIDASEEPEPVAAASAPSPSQAAGPEAATGRTAAAAAPAAPRDTERVAPAAGSTAVPADTETDVPDPAAPARVLIPPPDEAQPQGKRRGILLAGAAVGLAALAAGLITVAGGGNDNQAAPPAPRTSAAVTTAGAGIVPPGVQTPSPRAPEPVPQGWRLYREAAGFTVGVPETWSRSASGSAVTFTDPSSSRLLRITQIPNTGVDPYDYWLARQATVASRTDGYDFMRIARVVYRGWPTADWEYRTGSGATRAHVLYRIVEPAGPRAYTIYWSTADSRWAVDRSFFDTISQTFGVGQ